MVERSTRHGDGAAGEALVLAAVVEVAREVVAHAEAIVGRDGDVAGVVEAVDIGAEQQLRSSSPLGSACSPPSA